MHNIDHTILTAGSEIGQKFTENDSTSRDHLFYLAFIAGLMAANMGITSTFSTNIKNFKMIW
jgi:hypothetical protein